MQLCIDASASVPFCKRTIRALYALTNSNRSAPLVDSSARKANPIPFVFCRIRNDHAERQKHGPNETRNVGRSLGRARRAFRTLGLSVRAEPARLNSAIAWLFVLGASCFALGTIPAYVDAVGAAADATTFFVGSIFFTSASYCQLVQAQSPGMTGVDERRQHAHVRARPWA